MVIDHLLSAIPGLPLASCFIVAVMTSLFFKIEAVPLLGTIVIT